MKHNLSLKISNKSEVIIIPDLEAPNIEKTTDEVSEQELDSRSEKSEMVAATYIEAMAKTKCSDIRGDRHVSPETPGFEEGKDFLNEETVEGREKVGVTSAELQSTEVDFSLPSLGQACFESLNFQAKDPDRLESPVDCVKYKNGDIYLSTRNNSLPGLSSDRSLLDSSQQDNEASSFLISNLNELRSMRVRVEEQQAGLSLAVNGNAAYDSSRNAAEPNSNSLSDTPHAVDAVRSNEIDAVLGVAQQNSRRRRRHKRSPITCPWDMPYTGLPDHNLLYGESPQEALSPSEANSSLAGMRSSSLSEELREIPHFKYTIHELIRSAQGNVAVKPLSGTSALTLVPVANCRQGSMQESKNSLTLKYDPYVPYQSALTGLSDGTYKSGILRVSAGNPDQAYISDLSTPGAPDYLIEGRRSRNRSVHGDTVVFEVLEKSLWVQIKDPYSVSTNPKSDSDSNVGSDSSSESFYKTCKVVHVLEFGGKDKTYVAVLRPNRNSGNVQMSTNNNSNEENSLYVGSDQNFVRAVPIDRRVPWILIPVASAKNYVTLPGLLSNDELYTVQIKMWKETNVLPSGQILEYVGNISDLNLTETISMIDNSLEGHMVDFSTEAEDLATEIATQCQKNFHKETLKREDFRTLTNCRVMTIDPATARDLDDAINIRLDTSMDSLEYEIGVHIADVTHFVLPGSALDDEAQNRCTTLYLTRRNYPMLPRTLCDKLCSLNPNEDKLTFSVVFNVRPDGSLSESKSPRFYSSVIRSCVRFNYDEVQVILDTYRSLEGCSDQEQKMDGLSHPEISGGHTWNSVWKDLVLLESLTQQSRAARFKEGSLQLNDSRMDLPFEAVFGEGQSVSFQDRIDNDHMTKSNSKIVKPEVLDLFDGDSDVVESFEDSSHHLIEELMLKANVLVATQLFNSVVSDIAVLRRHKNPSPAKTAQLQKYLRNVGIESDFSSSGSTHTFLKELELSHGALVERSVEQLFLKLMFPAEYVVTAFDDSLSHFALNFPIYTHFTSPIRRYADIMVHRLLKASLIDDAKEIREISDPSKRRAEALKMLERAGHHFDPELYQQICINCNEKRLQARAASQDCTVAFFCSYLLTRENVFPTLEGKAQSDMRNNSLLDRIPPKLYSQVTLPLSIEKGSKGNVKVVWDVSNEKLQGNTKLPEKRLTQIIRPFGIIPVYVVPTSTIPANFATVLIPPWDNQFKEVIVRSRVVSTESKESTLELLEAGLKQGYLDFGGLSLQENCDFSQENILNQSIPRVRKKSKGSKNRASGDTKQGKRSNHAVEGESSKVVLEVDTAAASRMVGFHLGRSKSSTMNNDLSNQDGDKNNINEM